MVDKPAADVEEAAGSHDRQDRQRGRAVQGQARVRLQRIQLEVVLVVEPVGEERDRRQEDDADELGSLLDVGLVGDAAADQIAANLRAKFGLPINQEDMVYTLLTFSYVVIQGFNTMGYRMSDAERDSYIHCWNVVGCLMGRFAGLAPFRILSTKTAERWHRSRGGAP